MAVHFGGGRQVLPHDVTLSLFGCHPSLLVSSRLLSWRLLCYSDPYCSHCYVTNYCVVCRFPFQLIISQEGNQICCHLTVAPKERTGEKSICSWSLIHGETSLPMSFGYDSLHLGFWNISTPWYTQPIGFNKLFVTFITKV